MTRQFEIATHYKPQGDQPVAIDTIVQRLQANERHTTLLGVTGSGKTFTMANVIARLQRPALVMAPNKTLAAQLFSEFKALFPNNAVEYFISYYDYYQPEAYVPSTDTYIEKDTQINEEIDRLRNAATQSLLSRKDVLIVASVSCIYGLGNPADYLDLALPIKLGRDYKRDKLLRRLTDLQYHRNDLELQRGTYRIQGDVLEIILSSEDTIIRLDFFADRLEKIERLDAISGNLIEKMEEFTVFPAKHFVTPEEKLKLSIDKIRKELEERIKYFKTQNKLLEAQRIEQRTKLS